MRGTREDGLLILPTSRITPAYAGNTVRALSCLSVSAIGHNALLPVI